MEGYMAGVPAPIRRIPRRALALAGIGSLLAAAALVAVPSAGAHDTAEEYVTRSGPGLDLAGQPYTFTGINLYNANSDGWCREALSDTELEDALDDAALGGETHGVLRAWFFQTLATDKGSNARDWTRFDRTIAIAKARGYKVIATLTDQWGECGTHVTPTYGYKTEQWYQSGYLSPDPGMVDDGAGGGYGAGWLSYRDWVAEVVARYDDEPAILAWQLINEAEVNPGGAFGVCPPGDGPRDTLISWATDMSNLVRLLDANHLISLGTIGSGQCGSQGSQYQDVHALPNIDVCEVHDYTPHQAIPGDPWNGFGVRVGQCAALGKPLIVGETGIIPAAVGGTLEDRALAFRAKRLAQSNLGVDGIVAWNFFPGGSTLDNFDIGPGDPALAELAYPGPAFVVNTTDDTDDFACNATHCSLREAIQASNSQFGTDLIAFEVPGAAPHVIGLTQPLPDLTDPVLIDGTTQPGTAGTPLIVVDGSGAGTGTAGFSISGPDVTIRGLEIREFDGHGAATTGANTQVDGNRIHDNGGHGIVVLSPATHHTMIRNTITANGGLGIDVGDDGPNLNTFGGPLPPHADFLQNHPEVSQVDPSSDELHGWLDGLPGIYQLEFFKLGECDPSGAGEGDAIVASLTLEIPDGQSYAQFTAQPAGGVGQADWFAATATNPDGTTSEFSTCATAPRPELALTMDDEADLVGENEPVRYTLTVENPTQVYATNIVLQHTLPAGTTFGQAIPSQGTCGEAGGVVTCNLGSLVSFGFGPGVATVTVDVRLGSAGVAMTSATVTAAEPELYLGDNMAAESTTVAAATPATYTVNSANNTNDGACNGTHCSLREAILAANANPGRDTIVFSLGGPAVIQPAMSEGLPALTGPVVVDATGNPGWALGQPNVVLSGTGSLGGYGLRLAGGDSEVRGLIFNGWTNPALQLERWGGNVVAGNWFGLDTTGTIRTPNSNAGISVYTSDNVIGGTTAADRNVVSGSSSGIRIGRSFAGAPEPHDNVVQGNWIGLNAAGTAIVWITTGITFGGDNNVIGGPDPGEGNVVVGSVQDGILVSGDASLGHISTGNVIQGNVVGLDPSGTVAMPNGFGIRVHLASNGTLVGGAGPGAGNTVAGNQFDGINVFNGPQDTIIAGNRIGTAPDGITAMPNGRHGIILEGGGSPRTTIGGTAAGAGNVIAHNAFDGVFLMAGGATVLGNSIHDNGGLGIDRGPGTQASNTITNSPASHAFPVLTAAVTHNGTTTVTGTLATSASSAYRIELFGNTACDPSGNGEGQTLLAGFSVTTNGTGSASFSLPLAAPIADGTFVTATSTSTAANGQSSEFSLCATSGPPPPDGASGSGAVNTTATTDPEGDGATPVDPIETSVTVPATVETANSITITEQAITGTPPASYGFFGLEVVITAPTATAADPLVLVFTIDASAIPSGQDASSIVLFRNGVPVPACTAPDASATPDPCVHERTTESDPPYNGDVRLTVRTSQASTWNIGVSVGPPPFPFTGFFEPVNNLPTVNRATAGKAIPVKFGLGGDEGLDIFDGGSPSSRRVDCDTSAPQDTIEQAATPGASDLTYDPATGVYTYVWRTSKAWKGTCRELIVTLTDQTEHIAVFKFG
jgi:CSLREA domain-containing protein/uncharacterized repeat protein (TIGR01451 family)